MCVGGVSLQHLQHYRQLSLLPKVQNIRGLKPQDINIYHLFVLFHLPHECGVYKMNDPQWLPSVSSFQASSCLTLRVPLDVTVSPAMAMYSKQKHPWTLRGLFRVASDLLGDPSIYLMSGLECVHLNV